MVLKVRNRNTRRHDMVSIWWLLVAFIGGGTAGILVMVLMQMSGRLPEPSTHVSDLNMLQW
jgi:hypothetical protein